MFCKNILFVVIQWLFVQVLSYERDLKQSNDTALFKSMLDSAKHILIISGPELSAESGVIFNTSEKWRGFTVEELDSYDTFVRFPSRVWEYTHYKRNIMLKGRPNQAYMAIANYEKFLKDEGKGRKLTIITENLDGLHELAGSTNVIEVEGSVFKTKCLLCGQVAENRDDPICPALNGRGSPIKGNYTVIPKPELPRCKRQNCGGLLRPSAVWFGESLDIKEMEKADAAMKSCDICLLVGASSKMNPTGMIGPQVAGRGVPVGEFNSKPTEVTELLNFHFRGPCSKTITDMLKI